MQARERMRKIVVFFVLVVRAPLQSSSKKINAIKPNS